MTKCTPRVLISKLIKGNLNFAIGSSFNPTQSAICHWVLFSLDFTYNLSFYFRIITLSIYIYIYIIHITGICSLKKLKYVCSISGFNLE